MPFYPKVLRAKECASTPYSSIIFTSDSHLSLLRNLGVRHYVLICKHITWKSLRKFHFQVLKKNLNIFFFVVGINWYIIFKGFYLHFEQFIRIFNLVLALGFIFFQLQFLCLFVFLFANKQNINCLISFCTYFQSGTRGWNFLKKELWKVLWLKQENNWLCVATNCNKMIVTRLEEEDNWLLPARAKR